jgi:hypothetical protein
MSFSENRFPLFHSALKTRVNALMDMREVEMAHKLSVAELFTAIHSNPRPLPHRLGTVVVIWH